MSVLLLAVGWRGVRQGLETRVDDGASAIAAPSAPAPVVTPVDTPPDPVPAPSPGLPLRRRQPRAPPTSAPSKLLTFTITPLLQDRRRPSQRHPHARWPSA